MNSITMLAAEPAVQTSPPQKIVSDVSNTAHAEQSGDNSFIELLHSLESQWQELAHGERGALKSLPLETQQLFLLQRSAQQFHLRIEALSKAGESASAAIRRLQQGAG